MSECKRHKYQFLKNKTFTNTRISSKGTIIKVSFRGIYKCAVCGFKRIGAAKK